MADLNPVLLLVMFVLPLLTPLGLPFSHPPFFLSPSGDIFSDFGLWEPLEWVLRPTPVTPVAPHPWGT